MNEMHQEFIAKKKKGAVFAIVIAIFSIPLALIGFILSCVYFETIGKGLFYLYSFFSLFVFGFLSIWGFMKFSTNRYEIAFWNKKSGEKEIEGKVLKISSYTVDRHFDSMKIALEGDSFVYWFSPFGKCPLEVGKNYRLLIKNNWVDGWEKIQ